MPQATTKKRPLDRIITTPNPLLHKKSLRVGYVAEEHRRIARNMIAATLDWESTRPHEVGVAMAAIQVGQPYRIVIIRNNFENKDDQSFGVFVNPEIVKAEGDPLEEMEGCLSVPDTYGLVLRYPKVKIKAMSLEGKAIRLSATGFLARVLQHEIDHTNGVLFTDHVKDNSKLFTLTEGGKFIKKTNF